MTRLLPALVTILLLAACAGAACAVAAAGHATAAAAHASARGIVLPDPRMSRYRTLIVNACYQ